MASPLGSAPDLRPLGPRLKRPFPGMIRVAGRRYERCHGCAHEDESDREDAKGAKRTRRKEEDGGKRRGPSFVFPPVFFFASSFASFASSWSDFYCFPATPPDCCRSGPKPWLFPGPALIIPFRGPERRRSFPVHSKGVEVNREQQSQRAASAA